MLKSNDKLPMAQTSESKYSLRLQNKHLLECRQALIILPPLIRRPHHEFFNALQLPGSGNSSMSGSDSGSLTRSEPVSSRSSGLSSLSSESFSLSVGSRSSELSTECMQNFHAKNWQVLAKMRKAMSQGGVRKIAPPLTKRTLPAITKKNRSNSKLSWNSNPHFKRTYQSTYVNGGLLSGILESEKRQPETPSESAWRITYHYRGCRGAK